MGRMEGVAAQGLGPLLTPQGRLPRVSPAPALSQLPKGSTQFSQSLHNSPCRRQGRCVTLCYCEKETQRGHERLDRDPRTRLGGAVALDPRQGSLPSSVALASWPPRRALCCARWEDAAGQALLVLR